jgi:hypothetical protein
MGADVEEAPTNRRISFNLRRFGLLKMFVFVAIIAFFTATWIQDHQTDLDDNGVTARTTSDREWLVSYGLKGDRLIYAVFAGSAKLPIHNPVEVKQSGSKKSAVLRFDDSEVPLDGKKQLFEVVEGKYRTSDEHVTIDQFNSFMSTHRDEFDIDHLLQFAKTSK